MQLSPGQNAPLTGDALVVSVTGPVDLTALVLNADGKVAGDADMIFFNQPAAPGVALAGTRLEVSLSALRPGADQVVLVASPEEEDVRFGVLPALDLAVRHGGEELHFRPTGLDAETALVLCTVYRRGESWKLRAVGHGYSTGLAGVATDYGIEIADDTPAEPTPPPPANLQKRPLGSINLGKDESAVIPLPAADTESQLIRASLRWKGREHGRSDLDLYALYISSQGDEGAVHHRRRGRLTGKPWIQLDGDSRTAGQETISIVPGRQPYVLLCAYSEIGNGIGSFHSYHAHVVVEDDRGSTITLPLYNKNKFSYWVAIALIDATDPEGLRVSQVERYGRSFSERRPLLHPDGTFQMSKGRLSHEKRRRT